MRGKQNCSNKYSNCLLTGKFRVKDTKKATPALPPGLCVIGQHSSEQEKAGQEQQELICYGECPETHYSPWWFSGLLISGKFTGSYRVLKMML